MASTTYHPRPPAFGFLPLLALLVAMSARASDIPEPHATLSLTTGRYFSPVNILNGQGAIDIAGPGVVDGGATLFSLAAAPGAHAGTYPSSAICFNGPLANNPWATRLNNAGITSTAWSYGIGGYSGDTTNRWKPGSLLGFSQAGNTLTIVSFTSNGYDLSTPVDQITYTLGTATSPSSTPVASLQTGAYLSPSNILNGLASINISGPGVVSGGATLFSFAAAPGAAAQTYPSSATCFAGPLANNPWAPRLNTAGITSTAWSYGIGGYSADTTNRWRPGSLLGFSQSGNTLTIVSFTSNGYDLSTPVDQITYTLGTATPPSSTPAASLQTGNYLSPSTILNGLASINISGPGVVSGGATLFSLAAAPGAAAQTYPSSATCFGGPLANNPWAPRLSSAGITSTAWSYGIGGYSADTTNRWRPGSLLGLSQSGNTLTIVSFTSNGYDLSTPVDQITYTLGTATPPSSTPAASLQTGNYLSPSTILNGLASINISGPGVVSGGATLFSLAAAPGAAAQTYPSSATCFGGPLANNPWAPRLSSAGITSTAWSYGIGGYSADSTNRWRPGSLLGFGQSGNTLTIVSFTSNGYDLSTPVDQITYTLGAVTTPSTTPADAFQTGTYRGPSNILNGNASVALSGGGSNTPSIATAPGGDSHTYPSSATWFVGPLASSPWVTRLNSAGITSTAWSYGVGGYGADSTNRWRPGSLLGFSQSGNTLAIVSFTSNGYDLSSPVDQITYALPAAIVPPPSIGAVSPSSGPTGGGTAFTITGANFATGATVSVGGVPATVLEVLATTINGTTPPHALGAANVVVHNPDGQLGTLVGGFTYSDSPAVQTPPVRSDLPENPGLWPTPAGKAVVITHGWKDNAEGWVREMAEKICADRGAGISLAPPASDTATKACQAGGWDVWVMDWRSKAAFYWTPPGAYVNAADRGQSLASNFKVKNYSHVHFIAHSAGANLIQNATSGLKFWVEAENRPALDVHQTFLDAYDPLSNSSWYGRQADWADNYVDTRLVVPSYGLPLALLDGTDLFLRNGYSVDVTPSSILDPCLPLIWPPDIYACRHNRPYRFYGRSIYPSFVGHEPSATNDPIPPNGTGSMGYPLSAERGPALGTLNSLFPKGEKCVMDSAGVCHPGSLPPGFWTFLPGAIAGTVIDATTGAIDYIAGAGATLFHTLKLGLFSGQPQLRRTSYTSASAIATDPPAWITVSTTTTEPVNTLRFGWRFEAAGEGYLRVFVDDVLVREIDQRHVPLASLTSEEIPITGGASELPPGVHRIAFRLDGFGAAASGVELTGVELGFSEDTLGAAIASVSPTCASTTGGRSITISGSGFLPGATVKLAGTPAIVTNVTPTAITVTTGARAPSVATTGAVEVTNPGAPPVSLPGSFTYAIRGDANGNGALTAADTFFLNMQIFLGGAASPSPCQADANGNGAVSGADAFFLNLFVFLGGAPPPP